MNDETTNLDQADEDILTYTVSDEALEAAGGCFGQQPDSMWGDCFTKAPPIGTCFPGFDEEKV
jgi:hypothetical protein